MRWIKHLAGSSRVRRRFPRASMDAIRSAVAAGEKRHLGEVCFAVENAIPLRDLARGRTPRQRAQEVFAQLRVWDTEHNSGVLIYVLLADRAIEIIADRGIASHVAESEWAAICTAMQQRFAAGEFERGALEGVQAVSDILALHFPGDNSARKNELPDQPIVL